jgi:hypothetical protein
MIIRIYINGQIRQEFHSNDELSSIVIDMDGKRLSYEN